MTQTPADWSAADLELIVHQALLARDFKAVVAALRLMVPKDPHRAEYLFNLLNLGIELSRAERRTAEGIGEADQSKSSSGEGS